MRFNSIRFKLSILYSIALTVILIVFSSVIYYSICNRLYHDLDDELKTKADEIEGILNTYKEIQYHRDYPTGPILGIPMMEGAGKSQEMVINDVWGAQLKALNLKKDFINIIDIHGRSIFKSENYKGEVVSLFRKQFPFSFENVAYKSLVNNKFKLRAVNIPISFRQTQLVIHIGAPLNSLLGILDEILIFFIVTAIILLVLTSFAGNYFAQKALKPVALVSELAKKVSQEDLSVRIEEKEIDEEMKQLVSSFNVMISRLEGSFKHINEFSSHVAHELKTPLAILRGEIQLALERDRNPKEYKRVMRDCLEEIERMVRIIKDLLIISKLDYKTDIFKFKKINFVQFFSKMYEQSKVFVVNKDIEVELNTPNEDILINADKAHLRRLFLNLVNNAVKFTPSKGKINLLVTIKDSKVYIDIKDTGTGISEEHSSKIFEKFFRVSKDEKTTEPGTGLGLNIALSIAKAHHGDIKVSSQMQKGTTFTVILPLV